MTASDAVFAGSVPALYDRLLGPMLFTPYAEHLAEIAAALGSRRILETAAGTGIVTAQLAAALPEAEIVATDLNQAMLDVAAARITSPHVVFQQADAQLLPFGDGGFDLLVCQFGLMFFPDRAAGYREARRVLKRGATLLFNVWDRIEENPVTAKVAEAVAALFPDDPPSFFTRVPFGYHDGERIAADLRAAGFSDVAVETVKRRSRIGSADDAATGLCHGTPLRAEIEAHGADALDRATAAAAAALAPLEGPDGIDAPMSAHVVSARA